MRLSPLAKLKQEPLLFTSFEFVGIDVCPEGNRPAKSKHQLLETWPAPELVRDVAKFLGFLQFYSRFIPNFEIRVEALCTVTKQEYTKDVGPHWTPEAQAAWGDLKGSILANPCIQRFDHRKLIVLQTNFSAKGFGYVLLQLGNDAASATGYRIQLRKRSPKSYPCIGSSIHHQRLSHQLLLFPDKGDHDIVLETATIDNCAAMPQLVVVNHRGHCDHRP